MPDAHTPPHHVDWESPSQWRSHAHAELAPPPDGRVRARWTHVLALGFGAFALWFLLFAPSLQHDAQVSPVGARRTASLDVTGPVAALSRALQLSHIVSVTGRSNRLPGGTVGLTGPGLPDGGPSVSGRAGAPPGAGPRRAGSGSEVGTPTTVPPNPKLPTPAHPLRVLIVGDSIGLDAGGPLQSDLSGTGVVIAALDARESTGLTRPDYFNWPAELGDDVKSVQPQVVVVMIGANDPQDFLGPPDVPYSSPQWNTLYAQRVAQFMQIASSGGAQVVWVGMPPMQDTDAQRADAGPQRRGAAPGTPGASPSPSSPSTGPWARPRGVTRRLSPTRRGRSSTCARPTGPT